jgi:hypothetical protein
MTHGRAVMFISPNAGISSVLSSIGTVLPGFGVAYQVTAIFIVTTMRTSNSTALLMFCINVIYLQMYFVLTGEGVVAGKPLERSDWPRRTGKFQALWKRFSS